MPENQKRGVKGGIDEKACEKNKPSNILMSSKELRKLGGKKGGSDEKKGKSKDCLSKRRGEHAQNGLLPLADLLRTTRPKRKRRGS